MYVLKRIDQGGGYVAKQGHPASYTNNINFVRKFKSIADAECNRCPGNEIILHISEI